MRSFISTTSLALAASSLICAAPLDSKNSQSGVTQLPFRDGFPTPDANQLEKIKEESFGSLSNLPPPPSLKNDTVTSLRLVAFNEMFESFYFTNFLKMLDDNHFMRTLGELKVSKAMLESSIRSIIAVEKLHTINANNALKNVAKVEPIKPCTYIFPVDDVESAVVLANRFTDVVLGTLQDVVFDAAVVGDAGFTPGVASAIGNEAEQDGGFRLWLNERPQSQPFLTRSVRDFAFSILQDFVVPGSCPNANQIDLTVFQPLTAADPSANDQDIDFTFNVAKQTRAVPAATGKGAGNGTASSNPKTFKSKYGDKNNKYGGLTITYLSGQSIITEPVKSMKINDNGEVTVTAFFPQEKNHIFGLAIALLTVGDKFTSPQAVKAATLFGPAPLEVQEKPCTSTE